MKMLIKTIQHRNFISKISFSTEGFVDRAGFEPAASATGFFREREYIETRTTLIKMQVQLF